MLFCGFTEHIHKPNGSNTVSTALLGAMCWQRPRRTDTSRRLATGNEVTQKYYQQEYARKTAKTKNIQGALLCLNEQGKIIIPGTSKTMQQILIT